jgi:hypothetical protein
MIILVTMMMEGELFIERVWIKPAKPLLRDFLSVFIFETTLTVAAQAAAGQQNLSSRRKIRMKDKTEANMPLITNFSKFVSI